MTWRIWIAVWALCLGVGTAIAQFTTGGMTPSAGTVPQLTRFSVATLPSCVAATEGQMAGVTDALVPVALATVAGAGAVHVSVYCNGTAWTVQ